MVVEFSYPHHEQVFHLICDTVSCFHQLSNAMWSRGSLKFIFVLDDGVNGALTMTTQLGEGHSFLAFLDDFLLHLDCNRLSLLPGLLLAVLYVAECVFCSKNTAKQGEKKQTLRTASCLHYGARDWTEQSSVVKSPVVPALRYATLSATLSDFRSFRPYVIQIIIRCSNRNFPCISVRYPNCTLSKPYVIQGSTVLIQTK